MKTHLSTPVGLLLVSLATAPGSILWQDSFEYPAGQLTTESGGNWVNFSGTGNFIQTDGGNALLSGYSSSAEDVRRSLGESISSGSLYLGATVKVTAAPATANGEYFLAFYNSPASGGGYIGRVFSSQTGTGTAIGLSNAGTTPNDWATDAALGTFYKVIAKLDVAARTVTLGVFNVDYTPVSDSELLLSGGGASSIASVDHIAMRQATSAQGGQAVGSIWVGTTLADVATITVPEPGAAGLLGLGLAILALRRRS